MKTLTNIVEASLDGPAAPAFAAMAAHLRKSTSGKISAILGYGSALRSIDPADTLLDLYVLTAGFEDVSESSMSRFACRLVPPNVYYAETPFEGSVVRAKYAVMPLSQFSNWMSPETSNPYFWARFCQPARLLYADDEDARQAVVEALESALRTMYANARGLSVETDPLAVFRSGFQATYRTELRPESSSRGTSIVDADEAYFRDAGNLLAGVPPLSANWLWRRFVGKTMSLLRLAKAAFTFRGGVDYAAWKIARHSGVKVEITDWNRRHPLLTGLLFLPRLLKRGALR